MNQGTSALQIIQDLPQLAIVEKPAVRETIARHITSSGAVFTCRRIDRFNQVFQNIENGSTYHLHVEMGQDPDYPKLHGFIGSINGRVVYHEEWIVDSYYASKYGQAGRYLDMWETGIMLAMDSMASQVKQAK